MRSITRLFGWVEAALLIASMPCLVFLLSASAPCTDAHMEAWLMRVIPVIPVLLLLPGWVLLLAGWRLARTLLIPLHAFFLVTGTYAFVLVHSCVAVPSCCQACGLPDWNPVGFDPTLAPIAAGVALLFGLAPLIILLTDPPRKWDSGETLAKPAEGDLRGEDE